MDIFFSAWVGPSRLLRLVAATMSIHAICTGGAWWIGTTRYRRHPFITNWQASGYAYPWRHSFCQSGSFKSSGLQISSGSKESGSGPLAFASKGNGRGMTEILLNEIYSKKPWDYCANFEAFGRRTVRVEHYPHHLGHTSFRNGQRVIMDYWVEAAICRLGMRWREER